MRRDECLYDPLAVQLLEGLNLLHCQCVARLTPWRETALQSFLKLAVGVQPIDDIWDGEAQAIAGSLVVLSESVDNNAVHFPFVFRGLSMSSIIALQNDVRKQAR